MANYKVHPLADVKTNSIGDKTIIWQFAVVLQGAVIGRNCNINCHTFIENDVIIGDNVTIKSGVYLWNGLIVEDNVFIGPNVTLTNDSYPRSKIFPNSFKKTYIKEGASIGANATILGGIVIGDFSLIGAGSVVTKNVPNYAIVYGNPARVTGWVDESGEKLIFSKNQWMNKNGKIYSVQKEKLRPNR